MMGAYRRIEIARMASRHGGTVKLAAAELGIESFGMQLLDLPPGFDDYPEHDHASDGMEEVYVTLAGSGTFVIDGQPVPIEPSVMLRIAPAPGAVSSPAPMACACSRSATPPAAATSGPRTSAWR